MKIYTRRNALVGYATIKAMERSIEKRRNRRRRNNMRVGAYIALGLVSFGILAGVVAVAMRRRNGEGTPDIESAIEDTTEIVGEYVTAPEPAPAT